MVHYSHLVQGDRGILAKEPKFDRSRPRDSFFHSVIQR